MHPRFPRAPVPRLYEQSGACSVLRRLLLPVLHEPFLPTVHELHHLGLLVRGQYLEHLGFDPRLLYFQFDHVLRLLGGNLTGLGLIEIAALHQLAHGLVALPHLLEQGMHRGFLFVHDLFDLRLLRVRQTEIVH